MCSPPPLVFRSFWRSPFWRSRFSNTLEQPISGFLGIRMLVDARRDEAISPLTASRAKSPFWQGVMTEVLNPKTAFFFLSFIPQFVNHENGHVFAQFVLLGAISVTLNTAVDIIVTLLAGPLGRRIRESARFRRRQRTVTGMVMIGLGTYLAVGESN